MPLPSVYSPKDVESRWYSEWEQKGYFRPAPHASKPPFTIVIPPPNVTGILHMGHALNNTLQDVLVRFQRMRGAQALWVPGTDHAGIATQNVVEKQIAKEGLTRQKLGREEFVKRVWGWRQQYGSTIIRQLRRLGSSCDWSRERFTLDEGLSRAVETAFIQLYEAGLIYRGYYLVNWCPRCQTALSDEEVIHEEVNGRLWHIRYPCARSGEGMVVATTRPETMLGDVAVAVNPQDPRYEGQIGAELALPLTGRSIPVIGDEAVDLKFGTGAVKITPAHDPVDFEIARRHPELIPPTGKDWTAVPVNIFTPDAHLNKNVPSAYQGLDRLECRKKVVADLEAQGFLVKTEDYVHSVGHCYRCKTVIEPYLSPQWFVKMGPLAQLGLEAVEKDGLRFIPDRWTKVYQDWLSNIRDWCISRQIWWGHRIPIWYHSACHHPEMQGRGQWVDGKYVEPGMIVGCRDALQSGTPPPCPTCGQQGSLTRDPDVLDTWFSSWLWPFSTLGWPDQTPDLEKFYPTSVLVTGQDILFFWVARMVMAGKFFMKRLPFRDVYIHGIIRVEGGKKMSKSLGNIIDPLEMIDRLGCDALRFSIAHMTSEGQDLYLSEQKFLLGRNFANKLWNAARLILEGAPASPAAAALTLPDRWILSRLQATVGEVTEALEAYRFSDVARGLYRFLWNDFCDWYLETAKLQRNDALLRHVLEVCLRLLHPLMPFITEELWQKIHPGSTVMTAPWPEPEPARTDPEAERLFDRLQEVITEVRNIRATFRVPPRQKVPLQIRGSAGLDLIRQHAGILQRLAGIEPLECGEQITRPAGSVSSALGPRGSFDAWEVMVPLAGLVDLSAERQRIEKEMESIRARIQAKKARLGDGHFRGRAPADVVEGEESSVRELEQELQKWREGLMMAGQGEPVEP